MKILITSSSRKVSLIKYFKQILKDYDGGKVFAGDINPLSPSLYFADEHIILPRSDSPEFIQFILDFCKENEIKLIIPTRDEELSLFAFNKNIFSEVGISIMVNELDVINICQDKDLFIKFCNEHEINIPKTFENIDKIKREDFPVFVKPKIGKGGANTFKVESIDELKLILKIYSNDDELIIQEFVDASEYTIDLFADFNGNIISVIPRERVNVWGGESLVTKTFYSEIIINETIKLSNLLKLVGHNTIQCFFDGKNVKFIEINPRFGGAASISFEAGGNSPEFLIKHLNGEHIEPRIGNFKNNLISLRYVNDFFIDEDELKE
ncbi:MAG: ATP-grasp domain-containing protein [Methanobrevibacter sp.]|jgi:carbamoyl-phosphate synthase large subunit|nr:ATP-grasp domain-containing protein [Methanobrevibacter sp.]